MAQFHKGQILLKSAIRASLTEFVVRNYCPVLRTETVRFPRLIRDTAGAVVESGDYVEREVTVHDSEWFGRISRDEYAEAYAKADRLLLEHIAACPSSKEDVVLRRLVYLEDQQMYATVPFIFETDCPWTLEQMGRESWKASGGRISCSFESFQTLLFCAGFKCVLIDFLTERDDAPVGFDVVVGATGNY